GSGRLLRPRVTPPGPRARLPPARWTGGRPKRSCETVPPRIPVNGARALVGVADPERRDRLSAALTTLGYQVWLADDRSALLLQARAGEPRLAFVDQAFVAHADDAWWAELRAVLAAASWAVLPAIPRGELNGERDAAELVS